MNLTTTSIGLEDDQARIKKLKLNTSPSEEVQLT